MTSTYNCLRYFFIISVIILLSYFSVNTLYAYETFKETFQDTFDHPESWSVVNSDSLIANQLLFEQGKMSLSGNGTSRFPFIKSVSEIIPDGNSYIEVTFNFNSSGPAYGSGFAVTDAIPATDVFMSFPSDFVKNTLVYVWHDPVFNLHMGTSLCLNFPAPILPCENTIVFPYKTPAANYDVHTLRVERDGDRYSVFLDKNLVFTSTPTSRKMTKLWIGHPSLVSPNRWTSFSLYSVETGITADDEPTPEPLKPIIVIPGMFASVDFGALLRGEQGDNWHIPTFVPLYSSLINSLENAGYHEGTDLFVFAYDWRKRLSDLSVDLESYINALVTSGKIEPGLKVNLIGHSYGGLVGRSFAQTNIDKVNKLITAGSPHEGAIDAYGAWEGAESWGEWWQKILLWASVQRLKSNGETKVDAVRRISPSIQDVLPTFDYLEQDGVLKPVSSTLQRNYFLPILDSSFGIIDGLTAAIRGDGYSTKGRVRVENRSPEDISQKKWEDGKPVADNPFAMTVQGDGAVLLNSAGGLFTNKFVINANHGDLIAGRSALEKIFEELGLNTTKVITLGDLDIRESALLIGLKSPGTLNVCNPQNICNGDLGIYYPEGEKLFIYPGYSDQDLSVSVAAGGETGNYVLETGFVSEQRQNWKETPGSLDNSSEIDSYPLRSLWDTTPPVITPHVNPEQNSEGWNNSNLEVSWEVSDPDSEITASTDCGTTTINTETGGLEITCSATSYGGITSRSIMIKLDKTRPVIIGSVSPLPNSHGWNNTDVQVNFICSEVGAVQSGLAENTVAGGTLVTDALNQSMTNSGNCVDKAGNVALASSIAGVNIDKTNPVITVNSPIETTYAINAVVNSDWMASDSLSGLDGTENATVPSGGTVDTGSFGIKQFEVTATDLAGNKTTKEILYGVGYSIDNFLKPVSIDGKLFKKGSTIPIKFQLRDAYGRFIALIDARLLVNGVPAIGSGASSSNNNFRYDFFDQQYIFNLSTKMFSSMPSPYELVVTINGVPSYSSVIVLR